MKNSIMEIFEKEIMEDPLHKFTTLIDTTDTTVPLDKGLVQKRMVSTHQFSDIEFAYSESAKEEADKNFTGLTIISLAAETPKKRPQSAPVASILARRSRPESAPAETANTFSSVKARYMDKTKRPASAPHTFSKPRRQLHSLDTFTSLSLRDSIDPEEDIRSIAAVPYRLRELILRSSTSIRQPIAKSLPPKQLTLVNLKVGVDVSNATRIIKNVVSTRASSPKLLAKSSKKKRPAVDWQAIFGNAPFRPKSSKSKDAYCTASGNHVSVQFY